MKIELREEPNGSGMFVVDSINDGGERLPLVDEPTPLHNIISGEAFPGGLHAPTPSPATEQGEPPSEAPAPATAPHSALVAVLGPEGKVTIHAGALVQLIPMMAVVDTAEGRVQGRVLQITV